jgi:hypothetical protein
MNLRTWCAEVREVADTENGVVVCCNLGGTLHPEGQITLGVQSRSLIAAYELVNAGFEPVRVLEGGISNWRESGRDLYVFDEDAAEKQTESGEDL